jgi:hypothetical protein
MWDAAADRDRDAPKLERDDKSSIDVLEHIGGGVQIELVIGSRPPPDLRAPSRHKPPRPTRSG